MNSKKKEIKMFIKYLKKAIKFIENVYKWKWIPFRNPLEIKKDLYEKLRFYENHLKKLEK